MLGLLPEHARVDGTVPRRRRRHGRTATPKALRKVRRLDLGAVFQDPMTSLNPTMRIGKQVAEAAGSDEEALRAAHRGRHSRAQAADAGLSRTSCPAGCGSA